MSTQRWQDVLEPRKIDVSVGKIYILCLGERPGPAAPQPAVEEAMAPHRAPAPAAAPEPTARLHLAPGTIPRAGTLAWLPGLGSVAGAVQ